MAQRYWVGGTANWDGNALLKWATTSGGLAVAAEPTSADDVFFDANSGAVTVTVTAGAFCKSFNCTGFTGTFAGSSNLDIYGSLTIAAGTTWAYTGIMSFKSTGAQTITCNSKSILGTVIMDGTGSWTLQDDFVCTSGFVVTTGTFDANNHNVTCHDFASANTNVRSIVMGSGTWTLTSAAAWYLAITTNLTFNAGTSTIKLTDAESNISSFYGGGLTYHNLWNARTGSFYCTIYGSNTFADLKVNQGLTLKFEHGETQTISTLTVVGSSGHVITLSSDSGSVSATLSCASGTIDLTYASITRLNGTGGAAFRAWSSQNNTVTSSTGWSVLGVSYAGAIAQVTAVNSGFSSNIPVIYSPSTSIAISSGVAITQFFFGPVVAPGISVFDTNDGSGHRVIFMSSGSVIVDAAGANEPGNAGGSLGENGGRGGAGTAWARSNSHQVSAGDIWLLLPDTIITQNGFTGVYMEREQDYLLFVEDPFNWYDGTGGQADNCFGDIALKFSGGRSGIGTPEKGGGGGGAGTEDGDGQAGVDDAGGQDGSGNAGGGQGGSNSNSLTNQDGSPGINGGGGGGQPQDIISAAGEGGVGIGGFVKLNFVPDEVLEVTDYSANSGGSSPITLQAEVSSRDLSSATVDESKLHITITRGSKSLTADATAADIDPSGRFASVAIHLDGFIPFEDDVIVLNADSGWFSADGVASFAINTVIDNNSTLPDPYLNTKIYVNENIPTSVKNSKYAACKAQDGYFFGRPATWTVNSHVPSALDEDDVIAQLATVPIGFSGPLVWDIESTILYLGPGVFNGDGTITQQNFDDELAKHDRLLELTGIHRPFAKPGLFSFPFATWGYQDVDDAAWLARNNRCISLGARLGILAPEMYDSFQNPEQQAESVDLNLVDQNMRLTLAWGVAQAPGIDTWAYIHDRYLESNPTSSRYGLLTGEDEWVNNANRCVDYVYTTGGHDYKAAGVIYWGALNYTLKVVAVANPSSPPAGESADSVNALHDIFAAEVPHASSGETFPSVKYMDLDEYIAKHTARWLVLLYNGAFDGSITVPPPPSFQGIVNDGPLVGSQSCFGVGI